MLQMLQAVADAVFLVTCLFAGTLYAMHSQVDGLAVGGCESWLAVICPRVLVSDGVHHSDDNCLDIPCGTVEISPGPAAQPRHHSRTVPTTTEETSFSGSMNAVLCDLQYVAP